MSMSDPMILKDANCVYYRVGDTRTLKLISMMRDVFCGFAK